MRNVIRCLLACGSLFAISAGAANLIPNPDFDQGLTDWNTITPGNGTAVLDESTGYPTAPSVHLVSDPAAADVNVSSACVSVDDSSTQDLYVNARINAGFAIATVGFFSDAACAEAETSVSSDPIAANGGAWSTFSFLGIAPPNGTQSAEIILTATMGTGTVGGDVGFDHIEFGPSGTVPDGPNSM